MSEIPSKDAKFWDRMAKGYAKSKIGDEASYQHKLEVTRGYFTPDSNVMEFACGTGSTALLHAPLVGSYLAYDFSPKMIAIAQEKLDASGIENLRFEVASIQELDLEAGSLDVVMGHSILHLLEHPDTAIAKSFDLLTPGGVLVTSTVCLGELFGIFK
jgi:ubiquinone/menaquinone biosynthesis C-methylase UbiE